MCLGSNHNSCLGSKLTLKHWILGSNPDSGFWVDPSVCLEMLNRVFLIWVHISNDRAQSEDRVNDSLRGEIVTTNLLILSLWDCKIESHREHVNKVNSGNSASNTSLNIFDSVNIWCIAFFPVLKPLACGRRSRCLGWTCKLLGGQKFSIRLSALSEGFPQGRPLNLIKRPQFINSPGAIYESPCVQLINNPFFAIHQVLHCQFSPVTRVRKILAPIK